MAAVFNKSGSTLIDSLKLGGSTKASGGQLVVHVQNAPDEPELGTSPTTAILQGQIDSTTVEQAGPVRAVVKACLLSLFMQRSALGLADSMRR
jgi:hypothetical protein